MKQVRTLRRFTNRRVDLFLAIVNGLNTLLQVIVLADSLLKHLLH